MPPAVTGASKVAAVDVTRVGEMFVVVTGDILAPVRPITTVEVLPCSTSPLAGGMMVTVAGGDGRDCSGVADALAQGLGAVPQRDGPKQHQASPHGFELTAV